MRFAVVDKVTQKVLNVIEAPEDWVVPEDQTLIRSNRASPGDTKEGRIFIRPTLPPPSRLSILVSKLIEDTLTSSELHELLRLEHQGPSV